MTIRGRAALLLAAAFAFSACAAPGATPAPAPVDTPTPAAPETPTAIDIPNVVCVGADTTYQFWLEGRLDITDPDPIEQPPNMDDPADLLSIVRERGTLIVSTDPEYPPQSSLTPEGEFEGFDIDVSKEIATRLGVDIAFETPSWEAVTAGSWAERWDVSVGSMTIEADRKERLSFTQPYYYTPAQLAVSTRSGIETPDQIPFRLPDEAEVTTLPTDVNCAEAIQAGRPDFDLWISAAQTIQEAINAGMGVRMIGEPFFAEPLAVAIDKSGPPHAAFLYEVDRIIGEMHADGTLTRLSEQWYGIDITQGAD